MTVMVTTGLDGWFWAAVFFLVLQNIAAILRCYVRLFMVRRFGKDDVALLITLAMSVAFVSGFIAIALLTGGAGAAEIPFENFVPSINLCLAIEVLYIVAAFFLKISAALLLQRVLIERWQIIITYIVMAVSVCYGTFFAFFVLFQCGNPMHFHTRIILGQCLSYEAILGTSLTHSILNAIGDITLGSLPIIFLWRADLTRREKLSVGIILTLSSAGCIITVIRIPWIHYLTTPTNTYFQTAQGIGLMSAAELSIGITCICLATYRPLIRRFLGSNLGSYYTYGSRTGEYTDISTPTQNDTAFNRGSYETRRSIYTPPTYDEDDRGDSPVMYKMHKPRDDVELNWPLPAHTIPAKALRML